MTAFCLFTAAFATTANIAGLHLIARDWRAVALEGVW